MERPIAATESRRSFSTDFWSTEPVYNAARPRVGSRRVTRPKMWPRSARHHFSYRSRRAPVRRRSRPSVDPPVLVPGEHHPLHEVTRLVVGDQLDPRLEVVCAPAAPPLARALRPRVVGGERHPRVAELAQERGEKAGAEPEVLRRIVEMVRARA